jgi:pimeloyl-ACP methyl ester carboxylesterase
MQALFVHGMGRSPISGWPMLRRLKRAGLETTTFGYTTTFEDFARIRKRLESRLLAIAARGEYVVIGHSLGGVLLRAVVNALPAGTRKPGRMFLLGVPLHPARIAQRLARNPVYRALTRDCGQMLGSAARMSAVGESLVPVTAIAGTRGLPRAIGLFGDEPNDCVVSLSEASADWLIDQVQVPVIHTVLPGSGRVAEIILKRLEQK